VIDVYASQPWYADHLRPVYEALGEHAGDFIQKLARHHHGGIPNPRPVLVCSWGDMKTVQKLGYQHVALAQHGAGQSYPASKRPNYPSYPGGTGNEGVSLFLAPNRHSADRWKQAYPRARVEIVGCPKLATLPKRLPGPGPVVAVSFHWNFGMCPETMSVLPEYQSALIPLAKRYQVIGHGHPRRRDLPNVYRRTGIEHVPSFDQILKRADVYVFDNSSSGFEFAATGRPVVVLNGRSFRRDAHHGLRFWDAAGVGVNVNRPNDLMDGVARALADDPSAIADRERALDIVYQPRSGGARLMADAVIDWSIDVRRSAA
jgi:hypothetical protein